MGILLEIDHLIAETGCSRHAAMQTMRFNATTRNPAHDRLRCLFALAIDNTGEHHHRTHHADDRPLDDTAHHADTGA